MSTKRCIRGGIPPRDQAEGRLENVQKERGEGVQERPLEGEAKME